MLASDFINFCKQFLGRNEKDGSFKEIVDIYNSQNPLPRGYKLSYSDEWCAAFISAMFIKCGHPDMIKKECSCSQMRKLNANIYTSMAYEAGIQKCTAGDIVFYSWTGNNNDLDHVGLVIENNGERLKVLEGNFNEVVAVRDISRHSDYLCGFLRPAYGPDKVDTIKPPTPEKEVLINSIIQAANKLRGL